MNKNKYIKVNFISTEEIFDSYVCKEYYFKNQGRQTFLYIELNDDLNSIHIFNANDIDNIVVEDIQDET